MKKLILISLVLFSTIFVKAQTTTPAPTACTKSPCIQVTWTEGSQFLPGTATLAICNGSTTGCGTPSTPGPNGWTFYTVNQTTSNGSGITPTLAYGNLYQYAVNFANQGGTSAWTAPQAFQIGPAPQVVPDSPIGVTAKQL